MNYYDYIKKRDMLEFHRKMVMLTCSEDCWCWKLEKELIEYEKGFVGITDKV